MKKDEMKKKIQVLIVDDHFLLRIGLANSLNVENDMNCIAEARTGAEAIELYRQHLPDVVLMDLRLPDMDGVEATAKLRSEFPKATVIVISTFDGEEDIYRALQSGARSYVPKDVSRDELLQIIRSVHDGKHALPASVAARLAQRMQRRELTDREREVLPLIVEGLTNKQIANSLHITEVTVKLHVSSILTKLGAQDRTHASTLAIQRGIVHLTN
jgi:two-component system NarL family response regulator